MQDHEHDMPTRWRVGVRGLIMVVGSNGEIALRPKERAVVAAIAALHPSSATTDELIELVWGTGAPPSAVKALHNHVSRLRRAAPDLLATGPQGYRLGPDTVIDLSLGVRSETPLRDLADVPEVAIHRERLRVLAAEVDEAGLERLLTGDLSPGSIEILHRAVIDEPFRERRWLLLARAQAELGQRRDALLSLDAARRHLAEVGLTPGPGLRDLESTIVIGEATDADGTVRHGRRSPIHPHRDDPFVGRDDELATLTDVWRQVCRDQLPHAVIIEGPAGIGKTRLVDEFVRLASTRPTIPRVLWGRHRREAGRALGAFSEAIERLIVTEPALLPPGDPLRSLLVEPSASPDMSESFARTRLGRALAQFVDRLAQRPTIWLFDDVQWASTDSLALLDEALDAVQGPLLVIGTSRPDPNGLGGSFGLIARSLGVTEIRPRPLDVGDVAALIEARLATPVDADTASAVHRRTGGLPLYASELARAAELQGELDPATIPVAIREWVYHRVGLLDPDLLDVLRVAAVADQAIDVPLVARGASRSIDEVVAMIDDLVRRGLLVVTARSGQVAFSHSLTRDIVEDSIGPLAKRQVHLALAEALVELRPDEHSRIATHFDRADDRRAHPHAMIAGARSLGVGAWSHASGQFTVAVRAAATPVEMARALVGLGRALLGGGHAVEAADALSEAVELADRHDDAVVHARAALSLAGRAGRGAILGDEATQLRVLRAALDHVDRSETPTDMDRRVLDALRCELERELAIAMLLTDVPAERERLLRASLDRAEQFDPPDTNTLVHALLGFRYARLGPHDLPDRLTDLDRIDRLASDQLDPESRIAAAVYRCEDLIRANRMEAARAALTDAARLLDRYPDPYWTWAARTWEGILHLTNGDVDRADATSLEALERRHEVAEAHVCRAVNLVTIRLYQERPHEVVDVLIGAADANPNIPTFRAVLSLAAAEAGDLALAQRHLRWFTDAQVRNLPRDTNRFLGLSVLAHTAATLDDEIAASMIFDLLEPYDGQWVVLSCYGGGGASWGPVSHALGLLALTQGRTVTARSYLDRAAVEAGATGPDSARIERARSRSAGAIP